MTWQDELQHLDAELAAGRISAEEYRSRRDAALGRAQGEPGVPAPGSPPGGVPQQGQNPFPPAFSWSEAAQSANSDASTQIVPNPALSQQQPPPYNQPQQQPWPDQQANWNQHQQGPAWHAQGNTGTPWDSEVEHGDTSWMRQGPEVFESAGKSSKGKMIAGISIAVALAAVVAVAAFFFVNAPGGKPQAEDGTAGQGKPKPAPTSTLQEPPAAKPNPPAGPQDVLIPAPAGQPHPYNGPLKPADLQGAKGGLLQQPVRDFAMQNGMLAGWFNGTDGAPQVTLLAVQMPDEATATKLTERYLEDQEGLAVDEDLSYKGVEVVSTGSGTFRTAYTSHNWSVIVAVAGTGDATESLFTSLLTQQLNRTPPTVLE